MGLQIGELVPKKPIYLEKLRGKKIAIDALNTIYQFLSNIRQFDGTPLMDNRKRITSHLSGLFYRTIRLLEIGIKPIFVFDGKPPILKKLTLQNREERKEQAQVKFEQAKSAGDTANMLKYSKQTIKVTDEMVDESKKVIHALGLPVIQAPGEGEAQAALISKHDAHAVISQDYDCLLFGAPRLIQNLTLSRKKRTSTGTYVPIEPEVIELESVLNSLQITHDQLICLGILSGTDFNPGGIKGIGPKKALDIVKQYKQPVLIFGAIEKQMSEAGLEMPFDWKEIFELFKKPNVNKEYEIKFSKTNVKELKNVLCKEHDFSEDRVDSALRRLQEAREANTQKGLNEFS
ncbi:MAG: flap endonuclease-1 [archaeon]|nr:MAG: flap endonuclease-1 [archaeon]